MKESVTVAVCCYAESGARRATGEGWGADVAVRGSEAF